MTRPAVNPFLLGGAGQFRVVCPLVVATMVDGSQRYFYQHSLLSNAVTPAQVEYFVRAGLVIQVGPSDAAAEAARNLTAEAAS